MLHITFSKYDCIIVHKAYYLFTCTCVSINSFHSHSHSHSHKLLLIPCTRKWYINLMAIFRVNPCIVFN